MVINAGLRLDAVNYNTKIWSTPDGEYSPTQPWFWSDCGSDGICPDDQIDLDGDGQFDPHVADDGTEGNGEFDNGEEASTILECLYQRFSLKIPSGFAKVSPRRGFSHVITDQSTFTFNYGLYYQTPVYENVYLNTNRQEDPESTFEETEGEIGNATMTASRTQSYEFASMFKLAIIGLIL